jgi:RNA polymerase sigma-70 factor (ECF subfamily)
MSEQDIPDTGDWLAQRFEASRPHLRAVAYRMLGSLSDADDAVQESWLRLSRSDTSAVENLTGWLTTVTARICLDMLRSRAARREEPLDTTESDATPHADPIDPEQEALLAESVGLALLVVLDTLTPAERLAFVLHDLFDTPFDEVAQIVGRTPEAARQLASRARRRVRGAEADAANTQQRQREIVAAFFAAAREGDFARLLALLDPDATASTDFTAAAMGATGQLNGAEAIAQYFADRGARGVRLALINDVPGGVWTLHNVPLAVFNFTIAGDKITVIDHTSDADRIRQLTITYLPFAKKKTD